MLIQTPSSQLYIENSYAQSSIATSSKGSLLQHVIIGFSPCLILSVNLIASDIGSNILVLRATLFDGQIRFIY